MMISKAPTVSYQDQNVQSRVTRKRQRMEEGLVKVIDIGQKDIVNLLESQPCNFSKAKLSEALGVATKGSYPYFFHFQDNEVKKSRYPLRSVERALGDGLVHGINKLQMNRYLRK